MREKVREKKKKMYDGPFCDETARFTSSKPRKNRVPSLF